MELSRDRLERLIARSTDIVVATDQIDRIFERMYLAGKLDTPGKGMMYVTPLEKAATYVPPEIVKKLAD